MSGQRPHSWVPWGTDAPRVGWPLLSPLVTLFCISVALLPPLVTRGAQPCWWACPSQVMAATRRGGCPCELASAQPNPGPEPRPLGQRAGGCLRPGVCPSSQQGLSSLPLGRWPEMHGMGQGQICWRKGGPQGPVLGLKKPSPNLLAGGRRWAGWAGGEGAMGR